MNDKRQYRFWPVLIDALRAYAANKRAKVEQARNPKPLPEGGWSKLNALSTLLGAIFAAVAAVFFGCQLLVMQRTEIAETRPWITVELVPDMLLPSGQKNGKAYYFGGIPFEIYLTNVGHSPAFNINPSLNGYIDGQGHADPVAGQKAQCDALAGQKLDNPERGTILFPDQKRTPWVVGAGGYAAGFTDDETRKYGTMVDGHMTLQLWVIGCVDYLFADRKEHHQTGFVYRIAYVTKRADGREAITFAIPIDAYIPGEALKLYASPSSSVRTD